MIASLEGFLWRKTFSALHRSAVARQEISREEHRHHRWSLLQRPELVASTNDFNQSSWQYPDIQHETHGWSIHYSLTRQISSSRVRVLIVIVNNTHELNVPNRVFSESEQTAAQRVQELYWGLCFKGRVKWRSPQTGIKMKNLEVKQRHRPGRFQAVPPSSSTFGSDSTLSAHPHGLVAFSTLTNVTSHVFGANS